jgi:hypothetical protein
LQLCQNLSVDQVDSQRCDPSIRASGAQVALETKSGTSQLHGTAYYYYHDPAAASNNWTCKQSELASGKPKIAAKILQDTYGARPARLHGDRKRPRDLASLTQRYI